MSITRIITLSLALLLGTAGTAAAQFEDDDEQPAPPPKTPPAAPEKAPPAADKKPPAPKPPSAADLAKAKAAYIEGQRLIDEKKDFAGAVVQFKLSYRLSRNPLLLYNIGLALEEAKEKSVAIFYYKKFLADAPDDAPNRDTASARLAELDTETPVDDPPADPPAVVKDPPPEKPTAAPKKVVDEFQHQVIEEAPPGLPLDLTCFIPEAAKWQVNVFYRGQGQNKFTSVAMRVRYTELVGRVPAEAMKGSSLQYYIEARDSAGKVIARSGRSTSPNLIFIDESARPRYYPDLDGKGDGGVGVGAGAGLGSGNGGGPIDRPDDFEEKLKWGATATAGGALALSITFYLIASDAASSLEGEAFQSVNESCQMGNPCRSFSDDQKGLQSRGETFDTLSNVFFFTGVVAAGAAGYLWYRDMKRPKATDQARPTTASGTSVIAVPLVGRDFVGGGATVRF